MVPEVMQVHRDRFVCVWGGMRVYVRLCVCVCVCVKYAHKYAEEESRVHEFWFRQYDVHK